MDVLPGEPVLLEPEVGRVAAYPGERGLRRFAHHLAQLAGDDELPFAGHGGGLDEKHVPAHGRDREPGRYAWIGGALHRLPGEAPPAEPRADAPVVDADAFALPGGDLAGGLAAESRDFAVEIADAGLPRVLGDHEA